MRVFIAVDLIDENIKHGILNIQRTLNQSGADLKSVEPHNLHFTIRFLGEISEQETTVVSGMLKDLDVSSFKISFKGLGYFPNPLRISVIWIGIDDGKKEFVELAEQIEKKLERLNFKSDRKFIPHLTICRVKTGRNKDQLIRTAEQFYAIDLGIDTVSSVKLKKSLLTPEGPIYTDLYEKVLK
jgi:2'-5' RNA ligase